MFVIVQKGKARHIFNASEPAGDSLNDFTDLGLQVKLQDVTEAAHRLARLNERAVSLGTDVELWKIDLSKAYRQFNVAYSDLWQQGMVWLDLEKSPTVADVPEYIQQGEPPRAEDLRWYYLT